MADLTREQIELIKEAGLVGLKPEVSDTLCDMALRSELPGLRKALAMCHSHEVESDVSGDRYVDENELRAEITRQEEQRGDRPCTCHPDDNPPRPCPRKYALEECRRAALSTHQLAAQNAEARELLREAAEVLGKRFKVSTRRQAEMDKRIREHLGEK